MTHDNDHRLEQLIASAPREIAAANDNWRAIAERLDKPELKDDSKRKQFVIGIGSAAIFLLFLQPIYTQKTPATSEDLAHVPPTSSSVEPAPTPDKALESLIEAIEVAHGNQVMMLANQSSAAWQRTGLQGSINGSLHELRQGASQILLALKANPNDKQLWQLWLWVQRRELELLTQGQKLPAGHIQGDTL